MDLIRSAYIGQCRFFTDTDVATPITWYFSPPGAKVYTGRTAFRSSNWCAWQFDDPQLGELRSPRRTWSKGTAPVGINGQLLCGTDKQFRFGDLSTAGVAQFNANGVRPCCLPPPVVVPVNCGLCHTMPQVWNLTLSAGYADHACHNCHLLSNQQMPLMYQGGCLWTSQGFDLGCAGAGVGGPPWHWELRRDVFGWRLFLVNNFTSVVAYRPIPDNQFACLGPNTFTQPAFTNAACVSPNGTATITM